MTAERERDELLRPGDVEAEYRICESTLATWRKHGIGPVWQFQGPRRIVYKRSAIEAWHAAEAERTATRVAS